jgi:SprT protein
MTIEILRTRLDARVSECQQLVTALHPEFPEVDYTLFSRRRAAGLAFGNEHRTALNEVLLRENPEPMLRDTVAHEFAHILVWWRYLQQSMRTSASTLALQPPSAHGLEWQNVMRHVFQVEPSRCHRFDTSNTGARVQRRWEYRCACQMHLITTSKHRRAQAGARYVCADCARELTLTAAA